MNRAEDCYDVSVNEARLKNDTDSLEALGDSRRELDELIETKQDEYDTIMMQEFINSMDENEEDTEAEDEKEDENEDNEEDVSEN